MGSVVAALTILLVVGRLEGSAAFLTGAAILFAVGSFCAILCGRIDMVMDCFGGAEHIRLFVLAGVTPAFAGSFLYGWLLYSSGGRSLLTRLGL